MIELDGSEGEGGGQILRTGLALAMLAQRPLAIERIRAGRPKPGLMRQHLACVQAAAAVCGARVQGAELGAQALRFEPGPVRAGAYRFAIAGAGSCLLVLQTVLPALLLADGPSTLHLSGGTHNPWAPPFHFVERAFAPLVRRTGAELDLTLRRHGFHPAGGGEVLAMVTPPAGALQPFDLMARGELREAWADCLAPGLPRRIAARELAVFGEATRWAPEQLRHGDARQDEGPGNALMATLVHEHATEVFMALGEKSLPSEQVARRLLGEMRAFQARPAAAVGPHLADQLALLLALAVWRSGRPARFSCSQATPHLRTQCAVIPRVLPVTAAIDEAGAVPVVRLAPAG